jgi:hypothetical protein
MAAVATFLKGTVSESLKKLVQPVGLVPATIFVLLNLAFIYPTARDKGGLAKTFADLKEEWQVVVIALVILALGYLLLNAANSITDTLAGLTWRGSVLYSVLVAWQRWRRRQLERPWTEPASERETARALELATRFPPPAYVQPTRLGNAMAAAQHVVYNRYGIDLAAVWGHMQSSVKAKDAPALAAVKDEKATLDLLSNLIFVLVGFSAEGLVFFAVLDRWGAALASLLALPAAYIAYRVSILTALRWGDAVAVVFDLHRQDLKKELALSAASDPSGERPLWKRANAIYLPGGDPPLTDEPPLKATIWAAPTLKVEAVSTAVSDAVISEAGLYVLSHVDYIFIVTRSDEKIGWADADFIVDDPRVGRIDGHPAEVAKGSVKATAERIEYQGRTSVHWRVHGLGAGGSLTVAYRLPRWKLKLDVTAAAPIFTERAQKLEISFPGGGGAKVTFSLERFAPLGDEPELRVGQERLHLAHPNDETYATDEVTLTKKNPSWTLTLPT